MLNKGEAYAAVGLCCSGELSPVIELKYRNILHVCKHLSPSVSSALEHPRSSFYDKFGLAVQGPEQIITSRLLKLDFGKVKGGYP